MFIHMCINKSDGNALAEPVEVMKRWYEHGKDLFTDSTAHKKPIIIIMESLLGEIENAMKTLKTVRCLDG